MRSLFILLCPDRQGLYGKILNEVINKGKQAVKNVVKAADIWLCLTQGQYLGLSS